MKSFLLTSICSTFAFGPVEELFSLYFESNDIDAVATRITEIDPELFQKYELIETDANVLRKTAGDYILIDESGIYKEKNRIMTIPKAEIRENSKYVVRNDYLFGVVENDSFPCTLDEDHYLFLMPAKTHYFDPLKPESRMYEIAGGSDFLIFSKEPNASFSAIMLSFSGSTLEFKEPDPGLVSPVLKSIKNKRKVDGDVPAWYISPEKDEWTKIFAAFSTYDEYETVME